MNTETATTEKPRWPRAEALAVAEAICAALRPACDRVEIAGSLRRGKPTVGDVEILFVPKMDSVQVDFFGSRELVSQADGVIAGMLGDGTLTKRPSKTGVFSWGDKNKLARHRSGVPVDLFATYEEAWFNYLVCRTGPADSNLTICNAAIAKGWKWTPYGMGFYRLGHTEVMRSEREVFEFVGLPFNPPEKR